MIPSSITSLYMQKARCHSEPFTLFRTGSAKKETICHPERKRRISRFFVAALLRMTPQQSKFRMGTHQPS